MPQILPAVMGSLRQGREEGTLTLEQNDGTRRLYWAGGDLIYLQSDVAGEQFGNYLLRQGILDFPALSELLANEERFRLGEKVVQWGLMSVEERDLHLRSLQEQVMIHALEHAIIEMEWNAGAVRSQLSEDLHFKLDHRHFIWTTFQEAHNLGDLCDLLYAETKWRWAAQPELLESLSDLPLTPQMAYALSFLGPEAIGYETFLSLSGFDEEEGARLIVTLWALGGLALAEGQLPFLTKVEPPAPAPVAPPPEMPAAPTPPTVPAPPSAPLTFPTFTTPATAAPLTLDFLPQTGQPSISLDIPEPPTSEAPIALASEEDRPQESPALRARKLLLKAKSLLVQDRTVEAIRLLEQSVKLDSESEQSYESWLLLGKHRLANPAWSTRAIEALQTASRIRPKAAEPWALMGELYHRKEFKANAKACFKKALELDPSVPVPADVNLKEEDIDPSESSGLLGRFKALLGRQDKG